MTPKAFVLVFDVCDSSGNILASETSLVCANSYDEAIEHIPEKNPNK